VESYGVLNINAIEWGRENGETIPRLNYRTTAPQPTINLPLTEHKP